MPKKIVFVQGSPRKNGNTRAMASVAMEAARGAGAEVAEIDALELEFKKPGCIGCQKCQASEKFECSLGDELGRTVATLPGYDAIVMATPLYWWSFPAQIKGFIDRMYSLTKFGDSLEVRSAICGKTLGLLATAGGPVEGNLELLERQWRNPAEILECGFRSCFFPLTPPEAGVLAKDAAAVEKATEFGRSLAAAPS